VEANPHAVASAREWATLSGAHQVTAHALSVEDFFKTALGKEDAGRVTDIIINPPRTGLSRAVITGLRSLNFKALSRLTYVSCDLETLKRDLRELNRDGHFVIEEVIPFDMFPQTDHIETVVRLRRAKMRVSVQRRPFPSASADRLSNSSRVPRAPRTGQGNRNRRSP
jgi:23S rRNA (uracil1939-C5)-methyltransferase